MTLASAKHQRADPQELEHLCLKSPAKAHFRPGTWAGLGRAQMGWAWAGFGLWAWPGTSLFPTTDPQVHGS
jgi:hypothetical protein